MGTYTETIEAKMNDIFPDQEDYRESLIEVMQSFRTSDVALDTFLAEHGYTGDLTDEKAKLKYIRQRFEEAGITKASNHHSWYKKSITRKPAFELCFAFQLSIDEANDFFRRIVLDRGFDCHTREEAVYYYCLKNKLSYAEAVEILEQTKGQTEKASVDSNIEIPYTETIIQELDFIDSKEELQEYLKNHIAVFEAKNNKTARRNLRRLWDDIVSEEKKYNAKQSTWSIYKEIFGISEDQEKSIHGDRTIRPLLKENPLIHKKAAEMFPDRQSIEDVLSETKRVNNETTRKVLILLSFYHFWMKRKAGAIYDDTKRCISEINSYLSESGYPTLYYGNPYDWIFLFALIEPDPLNIFREYIMEIYNEKMMTKEELWDEE